MPLGRPARRGRCRDRLRRRRRRRQLRPQTVQQRRRDFLGLLHDRSLGGRGGHRRQRSRWSRLVGLAGVGDDRRLDAVEDRGADRGGLGRSAAAGWGRTPGSWRKGPGGSAGRPSRSWRRAVAAATDGAGGDDGLPAPDGRRDYAGVKKNRPMAVAGSFFGSGFTRRLPSRLRPGPTSGFSTSGSVDRLRFLRLARGRHRRTRADGDAASCVASFLAPASPGRLPSSRPAAWRSATSRGALAETWTAFPASPGRRPA